jgi:hypothetical protein
MASGISRRQGVKRVVDPHTTARALSAAARARGSRRCTTRHCLAGFPDVVAGDRFGCHLPHPPGTVSGGVNDRGRRTVVPCLDQAARPRPVTSSRPYPPSWPASTYCAASPPRAATRASSTMPGRPSSRSTHAATTKPLPRRLHSAATLVRHHAGFPVSLVQAFGSTYPAGRLMQINAVLMQGGQGYWNPAAVPGVCHVLWRSCGVSYAF